MNAERIHTWEEFKSDIAKLREVELPYAQVGDGVMNPLCLNSRS